MKCNIIIPAHNEEKRIGKTLESYGKFFSKKDCEILVVLNGCEDKTLGVVKKYENKFKIIKHLEFEESGKGFAVIKGFEYSISKNYELIGFVDADLSTKPEDFYDLIKQINGFDGIIASRWKKGSIIKTKQTFLRRITSRGFNFLTKVFFLLPYSDTQCGAKLFKKEALKEIVDNLQITQWAFDIDLLYNLKINEFEIKEIPTAWKDNKESKLNLTKVPFQMFFSLLRLRLLYSPLKFIVRLYDKMPRWVKIHHL